MQLNEIYIDDKKDIFLVDDRYIEPTHKDSNTKLVLDIIKKNPDIKYNFVSITPPH